MKCRHCKNDGLPEHALYCPWCGKPQTKNKIEKRYPKARVLADGSLLGQLMVNGRRVTVKARHEKEYQAMIDAYRERIIELKSNPEKRSLREIVRSYIDASDAVLSPATIRGYETIIRCRFKSYMDKPVETIDFQRMINAEARTVAPKTVLNGWALISAALKDAHIDVPDIHLPKVPESDEDFLDFEQIQLFLKEIRGDPAELAALLALHSLRTSELLALTVDDVTGECIRVRGALVPDKDHKLTHKETNKNRTSTRDVPIMIPRLLELLPQKGSLITLHTSTLRRRIEAACLRAGVPVCSLHDLRRSFASLGYHLGWSERSIMAVGGWSTLSTVHKIYVKLSKKDIENDIGKMKNYYEFTTGT